MIMKWKIFLKKHKETFVRLKKSSIFASENQITDKMNMNQTTSWWWRSSRLESRE